MPDSAKSNRAVVFVNPRAGGGKGTRTVSRVRDALAESGYAASFVEPTSAIELQNAVRTAIEAHSPILIALGGDGTLQLLVRTAMGCPVTFGVIPAGGGNDFAAALGIDGWQDAVRAVVEGKSRMVDVVQATFQDGSTAVYLGGGGVGLDAEAARLASQRFANWRGRLRYLAAAIAALYKFPGVAVDLNLQGVEEISVSDTVLLAAALNTPTYGGGLRLAPGARLDDGILNVVVLERLSILEVLRLLPRLAWSGTISSDQLRGYRTPSLAIKAPPGTWFHGDGELLGRDPCAIEILPSAIRIFSP